MISIKVKRLSSFFDKIRGLIGVKEPINVVFSTRFGIHTFGLIHQIDVLILDSNNKIVAMKKSLRPNMIFMWNPLYSTVVECKSDTIKNNNLQVGDIIDLHEVH